jgi:hypothetical protein
MITHPAKIRISSISAAAGLKSGQFNRERNFEKANIEYRILIWPQKGTKSTKIKFQGL